MIVCPACGEPPRIMETMGNEKITLLRAMCTCTVLEMRRNERRTGESKFALRVGNDDSFLGYQVAEDPSAAIVHVRTETSNLMPVAAEDLESATEDFLRELRVREILES